MALGIMAFLSILALGGRVLQWLGFEVALFFSDEFVVSLVYVPTLALVAGWLAGRRRTQAGSVA